MRYFSYGQFSGQTIAVCRLLLAFLILVLAITDHGQVGFKIELDDLIALDYLLFAALVLVVCWTNWWLDFHVVRFALAFDLALFAAVSFVFGHGEAGLDAVGLTSLGSGLMAQIIISVALRWDWRRAAKLAVLLNFYWLAGWMALHFLGHAQSLADVFRSTLNGIFVSILVVTSGFGLSKKSVPRFDPAAGGDADLLLREALTFATRISGARGAALSWINVQKPGSTLALAGTLGEGEASLPVTEATAEAGLRGPAIFDIANSRIVELIGGDFDSRSGACLQDDQLLGLLGCNTGVAIPIEGLRGTTRLILTDIPNLGWGILRLSAAIGDEVARGINQQKIQTIMRETGDLWIRQSLARDLHDTIAQSLAGMNFWLEGLKARIGESKNPAAEIDEVRETLKHEQHHVREIIERLKQSEGLRDQRDLSQELALLLPVLSRQWQVKATFERLSGDTVLPTDLVNELQRIVREAISNSARHGKAREVGISLDRQDGRIELSVIDDGQGFEPSRESQLPRSIMERVNELGGALRVRSKPGQTRLDITLPIPASA